MTSTGPDQGDADVKATGGDATPEPRTLAKMVVTLPASEKASDEANPELYRRCEEEWMQILQKHATTIRANVLTTISKSVVKHRVKTRSSLGYKHSHPKYNPDLDGEPVKDLLGLRVVVPFLEDVEFVVAGLQEGWAVLEIERKSEVLSYREFGYDAIHVILDLQEELSGVDLPRGVARVCEVQVRTYLQEAWAEVEHELIYKNGTATADQAIRKKLAALNASLALGDTIFQELRDHQRQQAAWGRRRFNELRKKAAFVGGDGSLGQGTLGRRTQPSRPERLLLQGIDAHNERQYDKAVELYSRLLELGATIELRATTHVHRGMAHFMADRVLQSIDEFSRAWEYEPRNVLALNSRALAWRHIGVVNQALADFDESLAIRPEQPEVHLLKAQTYAEMDGKGANALQEIARALKLQPGYAEARALQSKLLSKKEPD